jgi:multicomponent Na+:H+ antiporter subunit C
VEVVLAIVIGILFGTGVYMLLRRNPFRVIIGLALLTNAINLLIFTAAGLSRAQPPLIPAGSDRPLPGIADPLPQALILTAIVISFAVLAFTLVLFRRTFIALGLEDVGQMSENEEQCDCR